MASLTLAFRAKWSGGRHGKAPGLETRGCSASVWCLALDVPIFMKQQEDSEVEGDGAGRADGMVRSLLTVIERGLARRRRQEVGPPDRRLWVRHAR